MILFTTGRGTPLGFPAPTLKIATQLRARRAQAGLDRLRRRPGAARGLRPAADAALVDAIAAIASGEATRRRAQWRARDRDLEARRHPLSGPAAMPDAAWPLLMTPVSVSEPEKTLESGLSLISDSSRIAGRFLAARRAAAGLDAYPGDFPATLDEAYAIQDAAIASWGRPVIGWKVGRVHPPSGRAIRHRPARRARSSRRPTRRRTARRPRCRSSPRASPPASRSSCCASAAAPPRGQDRLHARRGGRC